MTSLYITKAFPPDIKPVHDGVYMVGDSLRELDNQRQFAKFEDGLWGTYYATIQEAYDLPMDCFYASQSKWWRGVTQEVKPDPVKISRTSKSKSASLKP